MKAVTTSACFLLAALAGPSAHAALIFGSNLVVNGNAEAGPSDAGGGPVASIPGFTGAPEGITVVPYANGAGYPVATDPGPADRGNQFFAGGFTASATTTQTVSVADGAAAIDAGGVSFVLGAYLGGFATQADYATFGVSFLNATGAIIGAASLTGPDAATRGDVTALLPESLTSTIPVGTRSLQFALGATRVDGSANDGYADDLSFVATAAAPPTTPPVPYSTGANQPCVTGSLQSYVNLSNAGCTIGAATFYHFSADGTVAPVDADSDNGLGAATDVDVLDGIMVTPEANGTPGLLFSSDSLFALESGFAQYGIHYYIDPPIDILGFRLRDAPFLNASVTGDVCVGNTFAVNCSAESANEFLVRIDDTQANDGVTFPTATTFNDVDLTITLDARDGPAHIESFGQNSPVAALSTVPEPDVFALSAIGGLAWLAARRRRPHRA